MSSRITLAQIVDNITQLSAAVKPAGFIYDFLTCFGLPKATIARLKGAGGVNVAKKAGCTLLKTKVYFEPLRADLLKAATPMQAIEAAQKDSRIAANKPRFLIATDFKTLAAFDTKRRDTVEFPIGDLHEHYTFFLPLAGMEKSSVHAEAEADVKAAENMAKLYDLIRADNPMSQEPAEGRFDDITIFTTEDGQTRVEVRFQNENVWLTQRLMAELYECSLSNVSLHLTNIYVERELAPEATIEESSIVQTEGGREVTRKVTFYSLEAIIAVGYRVQSARATQFRTWATDRLKDYILKGFAIDSVRFKQGSKFDQRYFQELLEEVREIRASERMMYQKITDIYATAADYSPNTAAAERFFATVQNKLHFAITGHTAAEIIVERVDSKHPSMGLTNWKKSPGGKILKTDIGTAKNYLKADELKTLNHIVDMYLDHAEFQASRGRLMNMADWEVRLDAFLQFNEQDILTDKGRVSHAIALALAEKAYATFRVEQDRRYESDFDRVVKSLPSPTTKPKMRKPDA